MATAIHALSKVGYGVESTPGTLVVADTALVTDAGVATYTEIMERQVRSAPRGVLTEVEDVLTRQGSEISYTQDLTWEEFPIVLGGGLDALSGAGDGPYTYTVTPSMTAPDALNAFSFEVVASDGATDHLKRSVAYAQCSEFSVSGNFGEPAQLSATWFGRAGQALSSPATVTPLTGRTIVPADLFAVKIDTSWANLGNTAKAGLVRSFTYTVNTGVQPNYTLDGRADLDYTAPRRGMITGDLQMVAEFDANAATELAAWRAGTLRFISLEAAGASSRSIKLQAAVKYVEAPSISEADGLVTVSLNGRFRYDPTSGNVIKFIVVNGIASY
jgi:hypothetical protein